MNIFKKIFYIIKNIKLKSKKNKIHTSSYVDIYDFLYFKDLENNGNYKDYFK